MFLNNFERIFRVFLLILVPLGLTCPTLVASPYPFTALWSGEDCASDSKVSSEVSHLTEINFWYGAID